MSSKSRIFAKFISDTAAASTVAGVWNRVITPSEVTYLHNVYSLA
jgi:hypothetical protein